VASGILQDARDREECLSDTWLAAWNSMPPQRPALLSAYLARITRNLAFNRWQAARAAKRGGGEPALALEELEECVSGGSGPENALEEKELISALRSFLETLPTKQRAIFLRRYWLVQPVGQIARELYMLPGAVSMSLTRTRRELADYLKERGFEL
jgi:RNA polymerase sigma-70 factor (ECF subfamily)